MALARKRKPLIDIQAMYAKAKADVATYHDIIEQITYLIEKHPEVSKQFLCETILKSFGVDHEWFNDMQLIHKQDIIDSVRSQKPRG